MTTARPWLAGVGLPCPAPGWTDRSLLAFAGPADDGAHPPCITLSHDRRTAGESFAAYVQRQSQALAAQLPGFALRRPGLLAGGPAELAPGRGEARDLLFTWQAGATVLVQWVAWEALPAGGVLALAATSAHDRFEAHRPVFESAWRTLDVDPVAFSAPGGRP